MLISVMSFFRILYAKLTLNLVNRMRLRNNNDDEIRSECEYVFEQRLILIFGLLYFETFEFC